MGASLEPDQQDWVFQEADWADRQGKNIKEWRKNQRISIYPKRSLELSLWENQNFLDILT